MLKKYKKILVVGSGRVAKSVFDIVKSKTSDAVWYNGKCEDAYFNTLKNTFIINANSIYIYKKECIKNNFIINYHNALLPRHRGLNAAIWAIYNGDKYSGICWHIVEPSIDSGDILVCKRIKIEPDMDSLQLLVTQANAAVEAFKSIFDSIMSGDLKSRPQKKTGTSYHGKEMPNNGVLNLTWKFEKISRFLRSFACVVKKPKVKIDGKWQDVVSYDISPNRISIKCINSIIRIENERN